MKKSLAKFFTSIYHYFLLKHQAHMNAKAEKAGARVISVGNITWGGTGKTPLVISLAKSLNAQGKKIAVLTRGYGQDEVQELKSRLPGITVLAGKSRVQIAKEAVEKHKAEILILDDGFQHLYLKRDLDIVNINSTCPFGPGGLIPQGTLREPLEHLKRAQVFVLTKSNIGSKNLHLIRQKLLSIKPEAVIFEAIHKPEDLIDIRRKKSISLDYLRNRKVGALSGIGDPYSFEKTAELLGADIVFAARFDDHHHYSTAEVEQILKRCKEQGVRDVVTTEKDFYRLEPVVAKLSPEQAQAVNFLVLQIEFELNDEEDFIRRCLNS